MFKKFIKRPVLAIVISIIIVFLGSLSITQLPISQYPSIAPTNVNVFFYYPGASANVLVNSTLIPLETAINGVQGARYITSAATSAGEGTIKVVFEPGTDPYMAAVRVKTRVSQVLPFLPILVQKEGVILRPIQPSMLMYLNFYNKSKKNKSIDEKYLFNYAYTKILPNIQRIRGISQAKILGNRKYAMRVWLKPDRMRAYKVSAVEVQKAMKEQSILARPGRLGRSSGITSQSKEYVLVYKNRYSEPDQYKNIIIRANEKGEILRLSDIADVELGSEFFDIYSNLDGQASASIMLKQTVGSNGSEVIKMVKEKLKELEPDLPPNVGYKISYDVSKFLDASIEQVLGTLRDAFILVAIVVFLFLGDWRSTLIPIIAVPVSLIGAFFIMQLLGLSINLITLFALVLAIGIVVDDAIVVVEAVHVKMEEENMTPYQAAGSAISEIGGAIIAITLVMVSVFIPICFMSGPVGVFYRQFSITMAGSIIISALVALTLTPVLCAMVLKNNHGKHRKKSIIDKFIDWFNRGFEKLTGRYVKILNKIVARRIVTFGILAAFCAGIFFTSEVLPSGFIPSEDQGMIYGIIQTPPGSTLEMTNAVAEKLQKICEETEGVESVTSLAGFEIMTQGRGSNAGTCLINLKPWSEREHDVREIMEELEEKTRDLGAIIEYFEPPAVPGFGSSAGFSTRLLDKTDNVDYQKFDEINKAFMAKLKKRPEMKGLFTFYAANYPQYILKIDNKIAMQKGVTIDAALENLNILIGSTYEQGFVRFGRFFKVYTQAAPEYRRLPSDLKKFYVKNDRGEMVPYSSFMTLEKTMGPNEISRYNLYNSAAIRGLPAKGYTSSDAINAIKEVAKTLPRGYDVGWEGLSYDQSRRGNESIYIFIIVLVFVYFVLAAQYESFLLPLAVILSLPVGIFGSFFLLKAMGLSNDVYAQIGVIMLVGLLGKNAVLIVEFAVKSRSEGATILDAAIEGAKARFRPILMTSFAFVAGLIPLVIATGAGAIGNRTIGGSAMGGMLIGTIFGVFVIPGLYYIFARMADGRSLIKDEENEPISEEFIRRSEAKSLSKSNASKIRELGNLLRNLTKRKKMNNIKASIFKIRSLYLVGAIAVVTLNSCGSVQKIREENKTVPDQYKGASTDTINTVDVKWKDFFSKDSNLIALIDTGLANNQALNIMLQQIDISKNVIKARKGQYLPFVSAYAGADVTKVGEYTRNGAVEKNLNIKGGQAFPDPLRNFALGLSASWEIDVWKKLRNSKKAAVFQYLSTIEGKNFMVTNLVSEIASSYYELMALDNQLAIIQQNLKIQINAQKMVRLQKQAARATLLAVRRFDAAVLKNQSNIFDIKQAIVETENRINFLVGRYPQHVERNSENFIDKKIDTISSGIPSQLLQNRPDIRRAEYELAAAKLDTKVARANFYPSFGISAGLGLGAFKTKFLTKTPQSILYSLVGDVVGSLINRNAIKAEYRSANDRQLQAVYEYEKSILNGYIEVQNQLSNIKNLNSSYGLRKKRVEALNEAIDLSIRLFKAARAEYTEVLFTQREALDSKVEIIDTKKEQMLAHVKVYKALGGGWN